VHSFAAGGNRFLCPLTCQRDGIITIRYGLGGPGIESWCVEFLLARPDHPWGPPSLLYNGCPVSLPGEVRPSRGFDHLHPSSAEVKERVELYFYSQSGPSWLVLG
jgi:hypothetical protein